MHQHMKTSSHHQEADTCDYPTCVVYVMCVALHVILQLKHYVRWVGPDCFCSIGA